MDKRFVAVRSKYNAPVIHLSETKRFICSSGGGNVSSLISKGFQVRFRKSFLSILKILVLNVVGRFCIISCTVWSSRGLFEPNRPWYSFLFDSFTCISYLHNSTLRWNNSAYFPHIAKTSCLIITIIGF